MDAVHTGVLQEALDVASLDASARRWLAVQLRSLRWKVEQAPESRLGTRLDVVVNEL